jgi:hypothetical protein
MAWAVLMDNCEMFRLFRAGCAGSFPPQGVKEWTVSGHNRNGSEIDNIAQKLEIDRIALNFYDLSCHL